MSAMKIGCVLLVLCASGCELVSEEGDEVELDTIESASPDLVVRTDRMQNQWLVRVEDFRADECAAAEGGVTTGTHPVLRFTVNTPNIGTADLVVGDPNEHVAAADGLYEYATCHRHFHFRHYATYELVDPATNKVWRAAKRGFCMIDMIPNPAGWGQPPRKQKYKSCGAVGIPGNQGISAGWSDEYYLFLSGQFFVLDGGDGQDPVPPGTYQIRVTVNPPFDASEGEPCPNVDGAGRCRQLFESSYTNNVGTSTVIIPSHPGRAGHGPGKTLPATGPGPQK